MNDFRVWEDIGVVRELLGLSMQELADEIGVSRMTLNRWREDEANIPKAGLAAFYGMAFRKKIRLNRIREQLFREDYSDNFHVVLFHGAKTCLEGGLSVERSRSNNDFGRGFYCGESLEQSAMFVSGYPDSSLYILGFCRDGLRAKTFRVGREWMLLIAYFRNRLGEFANSSIVMELVRGIADADYLVAPIADNRMFEIIDSFIDGEITDVQCQHCLSATSLGYQYVFRTQRALDQVCILSHCYLAREEKQFYLTSRREAGEVSRDKVRIARKQYRGQGKYIEEILL